MKDNKVLRIIASVLFGSGVGICVGVASGSAIAGVLVGTGLALCFGVALLKK